MNRSSLFLGSSNGYDLADGFLEDGDSSFRPSIKKRRGGDSPFNDIATRIGTRFPSFSRRWKSRKVSVGSGTDTGRERTASYSASSRASSLTIHSTIDAPDTQNYDLVYASTPASPKIEDDDEQWNRRGSAPTSIDTSRANRDEETTEGGQATTPLLPPLMVPDSVMAASKEESIQSPLQSPTVAAFPDAFSVVNSPIVEKVACTPVMSGIPSPPLSTKPSVASLHHQATAHLVPSDQIPVMKLADPEDEWAQRLGHANFDIHPEPYRPETFDVEASEQFHSNWALARCNYTKHLVRTGEHFGVTSKTYKLTEEKWSEIDARWREENEGLIRNTTAMTGEDTTALRETTAGSSTVVEIPSLNDPRSEGKFPKLGDEVIVGPMVQIAARLQRKPSKKATLFKFLHDVQVPDFGLVRHRFKSP